MHSTIEFLGAPRHTSIVVHEAIETGGSCRLVFNEATVLAVRHFSFADIPAVAAARRLATAGAYLLADKMQASAVYAGETGNIDRRLVEQFNDPNKAFAREVFVITPQAGELEKQEAIHLQKRFSELVTTAGSAQLIAGTPACAADLPPHRIHLLDRMITDVLPLLLDAGCTCFVPAPPPKAASASTEERPAVHSTDDQEDPTDDADEGEPMEVGVSTVPLGVAELALAHGDLWARGYEHGPRFVVAAGSEMRREPNAIHPRALERRRQLEESDTAVPIPGVDDRLRLAKAVAFPSAAIAAKVLTGTHVGSRSWRPLEADQPYVIAV